MEADRNVTRLDQKFIERSSLQGCKAQTFLLSLVCGTFRNDFIPVRAESLGQPLSKEKVFQMSSVQLLLTLLFAKAFIKLSPRSIVDSGTVVGKPLIVLPSTPDLNRMICKAGNCKRTGFAKHSVH